MPRSDALTALKAALAGITAIPAASRTVYETWIPGSPLAPGLFIAPSIVFDDDKLVDGPVTTITQKRVEFAVILTVLDGDYDAASPNGEFMDWYEAIDNAVSDYMADPANYTGTSLVAMYLTGEGEGGAAQDAGRISLGFNVRAHVA